MTPDQLEQRIEAVQKSTRVGVSWLLPAHEWLRGKSKHYYNWHLNPHHNKVHWATTTAVMLMFVVSTFLSYFAGSLQFAKATDIVISTNTNWTEGTYNYGDITVNSGANLTIAGGSTVNATGTITVTGNSTITIQSKNNTGQVGGQWVGVGSTINAANISVALGSTITASGQGYTGVTSGTGLGPSGGYSSNSGNGGGHAGAGTQGYLAAAQTYTPYGSSTAPVTLGSSGGGNTEGTPLSGAGGGAITLNVTSTLTLAGTIAANGGNTPSGSRGGAGAGGSIYTTVGTITGSGTFTANGGSWDGCCAGAGGGGRVAVYYATNNSFGGFTNSTTSGGTGYNSSTGGVGTIGFFDTSEGTGNHKLTVYKNFIYAADSSITIKDITVGTAVATGATLTIGGGSTVTASGTITVTGNSTITIQGKNTTATDLSGVGVTLNAATVTVDSGSSISANNQGYAGVTTGTGSGPAGGYTGNGGSGGGHAGAGTAGYQAAAQTYALYGSSAAPVTLGSSGGYGWEGSTLSGAGGGAITLNVSSILTLNGTGSITANGGGGTGDRAGPGAGGSVYATVGTITGAGSINAIGGSMGACCGGGGGGGRVAVYYVSRSSDTTTRSVAGGLGYGSLYGGTGTIVFTSSATTSLSSPTDTFAGASTAQPLVLSVDDYDNKTDILSQIQYKQYDTQPTCSSEAWTTSVNSTFSRTSAGATTDGWSMYPSGSITNGLLDVSAGAQTPQFVPSLTSAKYYCWRAKSASLAALNDDDYTMSLLHTDGTDASTTFTNSSQFAHAFTYGNQAQIDTAQSKFGGASGLFDGATDYLTSPDSDDWSFGTGDFTVDFWVRFNTDLTNMQQFVGQYSGDDDNYWGLNKRSSAEGNRLRMDFSLQTVGSKGSYLMTNPWDGVAINTWYHIAFERSGTSAKIFINGVSQPLNEEVAFSTNDVGNIAQPLQVGAWGSSGHLYSLKGWLDEFRISKGIARWTANFNDSLPASAYGNGVGVDFATAKGWGAYVTPRWFLVNTRPAIGDGANGGTAVTAAQNVDGTVSIGYQIKDPDSADTSQTVSVWLGNGAVDPPTWQLKYDINSVVTSAEVENATGMPTSGTLMFVDAGGTDTEEEATFTRSGNILTLTRAAGGTTTANAYVIGDKIYVKATTLSGNTGTVSGVTTDWTSKTATWTPKTDFDGTYLATSKLRVEANDTHAGAMNHGADSANYVLDITDPSISSFTISEIVNTNYINTNNITLSLTATDNQSMLMRFSNNNSTWCDASGVVDQWSAFATSPSWDVNNTTCGGTSGDGPKTVYVQIKDPNTNTSSSSKAVTLDTSTPPDPAPSVLNFSTSGSSAYRNILYWTTSTDATFRRYQVLRCASPSDCTSPPTNYSQIGSDITGASTTYYNDTSLADSTTSYSYFIKTDDWADRTVNSTATTRVRSAGTGIATPSSGTPGATLATITWNTTTPSNSIVQYMSGSCSVTDSDYSEAALLDDSATSHSVALSGLSENTTYYYKVRSRDAGKLEVSDNNTGACYTFTTKVTPTGSISVDGGAYTKLATVGLTLSATGGTVNQMKFSNDGVDGHWSDYEAYATSKTGWNLISGYGGADSQGAKTVYAKFKNSDNIESTTVISDGITYDNVAATTTAPSNITTTSDTKPLISWSAATEATSGVAAYYIKIGTESGLDDFLGVTSMGTNTSYTPTTALSITRTYYVQVRANDGAGNIGSYSTSSTIAIDVTAPSTNSVVITDTNGYTNSATVDLTLESTVGSPASMQFSNDGETWSGWQAYGTSKSSWNLTSGNGGNTDQGEKYVYVQFKDTYGNTSSAVSNMTVYDTVGPVQSSITPTSASNGYSETITYTTDEVATTGIYYDSISHVAGVYTDYARSSTDANYDTNHRKVAGDGSPNPALSANTLYYYRVRSLDRAGNATVTAELSFTTTTFPTTSTPSSGTPGISSATITWTTNLATNDSLAYGTTTGYGTGAGDPQASGTSHSVTITGLTKNTLYHYKVYSKDASGNIVSDSDHSFTTSNDVSAPTATVNINGGDTYTTSTTVNVTIDATDTGDESYIYQMRFSNNDTDWSAWETYNGTKSWTLSAGEGTKTAYVQLKDNHSNESTSITDTITYDSTAPTANTPATSSATTNSTKPTWTWAASTDAISGIQGYYVKIGTTSGITTPGGSNDFLAETWVGDVTSYTPVTALNNSTTYYLSLKAKDGSGSIGSYNTSDTGVTIDTTAPTSNSLTIKDASDAGTTYTDNGTVNLTLASTGASWMKFSNNGSNWTEYTDTAYATSYNGWNMISGYGGTTSEGTKTVYVKFKDAVGNETDSITDTIIYDATAPVSGSITIKDSDEDDTTYADNSDLAGNKVDLTLSATDATSGMSQMQFSNDGSTWGDLITYATTYNDTWTLAGVDGTKTVYVKFKDNAGNTSTAISDTIILDITGPVANIPTTNSPTSNQKPTWSWSASSDTNGVQGYYVKIGTTSGGNQTLGETWIGNNISYTPTENLSDSTYYLSVKAKDNVGNSGSYVSSTGVVVDTTNPSGGSVNINAGASYTTSTSVTLTIVIPEGATEMDLSNNGTTWDGWEAAVTSKAKTLSAGEGLKTVYIKFRNEALNESDTYTDTITYDATPVSISSLEDFVGNSGTSAYAKWTTSDEATTAIYYGTSSQVAYTAYPTSSTDSNYDTNHRRDLSLLNNTKYYYMVRSVDRAGNATVSAEGDFTTVTLPLISSVTEGTITISTQVLTWNTNVNCTSIVEYGTTSGNYTNSQGVTASKTTSHSVSVKGLTPGQKYYYLIKGTDLYGNETTSVEGDFTTTADTSNPTGSVGSINNGATYTNVATVNLAVNATDTGEGGYVTQMTFSNNGIAWSNWEAYAGTKSWNITNSSYGGNTEPGTKTIYVKVRDNSENPSTNFTNTIIYDYTAPTPTQPAVTSPTSNTKPTISWSTATDATSGVDHYGIKIGTASGGTQIVENTNIGGETTLSYTPTTALADGTTHYVSIKATDRAGNTSDYGTETSFIIDTAAPTGSISIDSAVAYSGNADGLVTLTLAYSGTPTQMRLSNNNSSWSSWEAVATTKSWNLVTDAGGSSTEGLRTVYVQFRDSVENTSSSYSDSITWDKTTPTGGLITIKDGSDGNESYTNAQAVDLVLNASDENSGIYQMRFSNNDSTWGEWVTYSNTYNDTWNLSATDATKTVYVQFKDNAGKTTSSVSDTIILDTTGPIANTASATTPTANTKPTWSWTAASDGSGVGVKDYLIKIGTSQGGLNTLGVTNIGNVTSYAPSTALPQGSYFISIKARDQFNTEGNYVEATTPIVVDTTSPTGTISIAAGAEYTTSTSTTLTLSATDTGGAALTQMRISNDNSDWGDGWIDYATTRSHTISSGNGLKTVYVQYKDSVGNISTSYTDTITLDGTTPTITSGPTDANSTSSGTPTSVTVSWETSEESNSVVQYGTTEGGPYGTTQTNNDYDTNHNVTFTVASAGTTYYYIVKSTDHAGNEVTSDEESFTTISVPTISNLLEVTTSHTQQVLTWTTNINTTSIVEYGTTDGVYTNSQGTTATRTTSHSVTIKGLTANQIYYYRITGTDQYGNAPTATTGNFTTSSDTTPSTGSVIINDGTTYTNSTTVNLAVAGVDTGGDATKDNVVKYMKFSNDNLNWTMVYVAYATTYNSWNLTTYGGNANEGTKTVYVRLKDNSDVESTSTISDTIIYDNTAPTANQPTVTTPTSDTTPTISWVASTDTISDIDHYGIKIGITTGGTDIANEDNIGNVLSYTSTTALTNGQTYYVSIKATDGAGKEGSYGTEKSFTIDTTAPTNGSISINAGAAYTTSTGVTLTISATDASQMNISNDNTTWNGWETYATSKAWILSSGDATKQVYIKFRDRETSGNESATYSDSTILDTAAATISNISDTRSIVSATASTVDVSWATDESANSVVEYGTSTGIYTYSKTDSDLDINHRITLTGVDNISSGNIYYYKVKSIDAAGNETVSSEDNFNTITIPILNNTSIQLGTSSNTQQTITWTTNVSCTSVVDYGTTSGTYGESHGLDNTSSLNTTHSVTLKGLTANTTYYYRVKGRDQFGNLTTPSTERAFTTGSTAGSITGVTKSGSQSKDVITGQITIGWNTNTASSSYVEYGQTDAYGSESGQNDSVTSHSVTLKGLTANTTYHYRVKSIDTEGRVYVSADDTFTTGETTDSSISEVSATEIGLNQATISWKTGQTASTQVLYSTNSDNLDKSTTEDTSKNTTHIVKLENLENGTNYYYQVRSVDNSTGDVMKSAVNSFSTITLPQISGIGVSNIGEDKVRISWNTNVSSDSSVKYNTESNDLKFQQTGDKFTTTHEIELADLKPNLTYYYQIKSKDQYNNLVESEISSFNTASDTKGPVISEVLTESVVIGSGENTRAQIVISWLANEPAISAVEYGTGLGTSGGGDEQKYDKTAPETKGNIIVLSNLKPNTTYHFRIKSTDEAKNTSYSDDYTILTPSEQQSILQIILDTLEKTFGWIVKLKDSFNK